MAALSIIWAIARKDLLLEFRNREVILSVIAFAVLVLAIFVLAVDLTPQNARVVGPGILWTGVAFAGVTGLNRAFASETERDTFEGLMLAPVSRDLIFLGKALGVFLFMTFALAVILPVFALLFNVVIFRWEMFAIGALAIGGFSVVGTVFAAMSARVRAREIMLPMLFLPVVAPLLMAAVEVTAGVTLERSWRDTAQWLGMAAAFDAVFFVVATVVFPALLED
ncbi:MAG: heme ABC transporter permease CcmB [Dehalococcoidia bacterium]|nr:heme ABC transporter permease CcmB [Dehalococcoidia bacterium]MSQ35240.1 heme ABC transporter permease CcmB [Dehalococcoidia bacterium]